MTEGGGHVLLYHCTFTFTMSDVKASADMMGSRADMISMKIDPVSRNQIWREHLVKESKLEGPMIDFQFNPATVNTVTLKPSQVDPRSYSEATSARSKRGKEIEDKINHSTMAPQDKLEMPVTRAQEIGWMHSQAWKNGRDRVSATWYQGKGTTDVTQFADAYCTMTGCSPFADKSNN